MPQDRVIGYVRVSTEEQRELGLSIDAQKAQIQEFARLLKLPPPELLSETGSAKSVARRPVFTAILDAVRRNEVKALMVWKFDRAFRSTLDAIQAAEVLKAHTCQLIEMTEVVDMTSPDGEFYFTLKAALAQRERKLIGLRTKMALAHAKAQGIKLGRAPFGLRRADKNRYELDPEDGPTLTKMHALRAAGNGVREIANALNARGVTGPSSGRWHKSTVATVLANPEVQAVLGARLEAEVLS